MSGPWRLFGWALLAVSMVLALAGGAGWWLYREMTAAGPLGEARRVVIPPKTGLAEIAGLLAKAGVVRYALPLEAAALLSGEVSSLQAGEYEFPAATSALQATAIIASGKTVRHKLTIPEGLTSAEVLALVKAAPALAGDPGAPPPEGSLMPDTYFYSYSEPRRQLIDEMKREMAHALQRAWAKRTPDLPLASPEQLLTLASIVEGEAARADERAHIAGVFVNRLRLGMPLDSDPTVIYALTDGSAKKLDRPLTRTDLETPSPYNTYHEKGLPEGPIDNPGAAALRAAAHPAPTPDLYFVADHNGGHVFAKTLAEHDRNVAQYRNGTLVVPDPASGAAR
ncbi:MAG TPA: endolytic transglycosylase MltG [Stellaceae bacterium]